MRAAPITVTRATVTPVAFQPPAFGSGSTVAVVAEKRAQSEDSLAGIKVSLTSNDGLISLGWSQDGDGTQGNRSVNFTIRGPKRLAAKVKVGASNPVRSRNAASVRA